MQNDWKTNKKQKDTNVDDLCEYKGYEVLKGTIADRSTRRTSSTKRNLLYSKFLFTICQLILSLQYVLKREN